MKCDLDGWKVDYSGSLRISHGDDVNVFIQDGNIPEEFRSDLDQAQQSNDCQELKRVAQDIVSKVGGHACLHGEKF